MTERYHQSKKHLFNHLRMIFRNVPYEQLQYLNSSKLCLPAFYVEVLWKEPELTQLFTWDLQHDIRLLERDRFDDYMATRGESQRNKVPLTGWPRPACLNKPLTNSHKPAKPELDV